MNRGLMRVIITLLLCFILSFFARYATASIYVTADAAIVIDAETGKVLYGKNIHQRRPPASITKIMTTILGIELGKLDAKVKVSLRAASQEGSSIYLRSGEVLTLEELLYGVMLSSGNDASVAVAEHIGGSVEKFAELMTRKAREIGAINTTFCNPNGLPDVNHLTTAFDLAMIMRYGMQDELFRKLNETKYKTISGNEWDRGLRNHNKLLWNYQDCDGGKTGYTRAAGRCLISAGSRNGRSVIAVVLHADQLWQDSIKLLDYGLDQFINITLIKKGQAVHAIEVPESQEKLLEFIAAREFRVTIPKGEESTATRTIEPYKDLELPILAGQKVGIMKIEVNGEEMGQVDLIAKDEVTKKSLVDRFWRWISSMFKTFI